jgi:Ricin-type beta-trefoil lectin domain-like
MNMDRFISALAVITVSIFVSHVSAQSMVDELDADRGETKLLESEHSSLAKATATLVWAEGNTYSVGTVVSYNGKLYTALVTHTAYVGANWNPAATPTLWKPTEGTVIVDPVGGTTGITAGAIYKLINVNSGLALDVSGCGTGNGTNVQVWAHTPW